MVEISIYSGKSPLEKKLWLGWYNIRRFCYERLLPKFGKLAMNKR